VGTLSERFYTFLHCYRYALAEDKSYPRAAEGVKREFFAGCLPLLGAVASGLLIVR